MDMASKLFTFTFTHGASLQTDNAQAADGMSWPRVKLCRTPRCQATVGVRSKVARTAAKASLPGSAKGSGGKSGSRVTYQWIGESKGVEEGGRANQDGSPSTRIR